MLGPLHGIFLVISLVTLVIKVWALLDAAVRPAGAFVSEGKQTKGLWVAILVVAVLATYVGFLSIIGLVAALVYLLDVRPAVKSYR
jgi:uncharacterized membrane protein YwzB